MWRKATFSAIVALLFLPPPAADAASVLSVSPDRTEVPQYGRIEISIQLDQSYDNPYDVDEVEVDALVYTPSGLRLKVPAFWYEPYESGLEGSSEQFYPAGPGEWRVRFAPLARGDYTYAISVLDSSGTSSSREYAFRAIEPQSSGFLRVDPENPRYFAYDDGSSYVPLGVNIDWAVESEGVYAYNAYLDALAGGGGNWTRLWMSHYGMGTTLEWGSDHYTGYYEGLGRYSQQVAAKLDLILEHAETLGVALQLVLHQHSQFETSEWSSWDENPYNVTNGGPCATSRDYFYEPEALALQRNLHRYIVARFAAYRSLLAWEIFNEADLIYDVHPNTMIPWARDVRSFLADLDPEGHLITNSYASPIHFPSQDMYSWDFNNRHMYVYGSWLVGGGLKSWKRSGRPLMLSEFGIDYGAETNDRDSLGVNMHNGIWSALMNGYAGGAMNWWWDSYVDVYDLWDLNAAPAAFVAGTDMSAFVEDVDVTAKNGVRRLEASAIGSQEGQIWVWIHDPDSSWHGPMTSMAPVTAARVTLDGVNGSAGLYELEVWDTWTGSMVSSAEVERAGNTLTIELAPFERDVALKLRPTGL